MRVRLALLSLILVGAWSTALAQPNNLDTSLHGTRAGKNFWYGAENGGFEAWTGVPIEALGCNECHGPTDADGNPYEPFTGADCVDCHATGAFFPVDQGQCLGCHGRQKTEALKLGIPDVHRDELGFKCWDCHNTEDLHGDGNEYDTMFRPGAIDADCEDCHDSTMLPPEHVDYDPHDGALHCTACHTKSVISCYNCHFESQELAHVKRAKQPISDFLFLVNREKDGKVYPGSFQSLTNEGDAFVAFAPYSAHTITREGRGCTECHNQFGGMNAAVSQYNDTGKIRFTEWDDTEKKLSWLRGIVPLPEDYEVSFKMDFITYDGDPSDPAGPSSNWSSIGKDTWDGHQLFFGSPMSATQMASLGFAETLSFDIFPWQCPNGLDTDEYRHVKAAIHGTEDFDVADLDWDSLMLEGVPVRKGRAKDVGAPSDGEVCDCNMTWRDGIPDASLKFDARLLLEAVGDVAHGEEVLLTLTGNLLDGSPIVARDCMTVYRDHGGHGDDDDDDDDWSRSRGQGILFLPNGDDSEY